MENDNEHTSEADGTYERKFGGFIRLCEKAKDTNVDSVIVANASVLGDTYDKILESLGRLADAGLALRIAER